MEDLKQEAALALLDAARRFDPAHGTKLLTYATPAIEAALSDYAAQYRLSSVHSHQPVQSTAQGGIPLRRGMDSSDAELVKAVCGKLKVSSKSAGR